MFALGSTFGTGQHLPVVVTDGDVLGEWSLCPVRQLEVGIREETQAAVTPLRPPGGAIKFPAISRAAFWINVRIATAAVLFGVLAVGQNYGLGAMWLVVFLIYLLAVWVERRTPMNFEAERWVLGGDPRLPQPGKRALP